LKALLDLTLLHCGGYAFHEVETVVGHANAAHADEAAGFQQAAVTNDVDRASAFDGVGRAAGGGNTASERGDGIKFGGIA